MTAAADRPARSRSGLRRAVRWAATALVVAALAWWVLPLQFGGRTGYTIVSGHSMDGTYHSGDLVVTRRASRYRSGDIVVYQVPAGAAGAGRHVVHRIIGGSGTGWVTKGDNNPAADPWHPTDGDIFGRARLRLPGAGRVLLFSRGPFGFALLAGILAALAVLAKPDRRPGEQADPVA